MRKCDQLLRGGLLKGSTGLKPGGGAQGSGGGGEQSSGFKEGGIRGHRRHELIRSERLQKLRAVQAMRPDIDLTQRWAGEGEDLERKDHAFEEKVFVATATEDDHPIGRIAIRAIKQHPVIALAKRVFGDRALSECAPFQTVQWRIKAKL